MLFVPRHLLGVEAATSILEAAIHGRSSGGIEPQHRLDLVARAARDLQAGQFLTTGGHHHEMDGGLPEIVAAAPLASDAPAPFYLAANRRLARPVTRGQHILFGDLDIEPSSALLNLRREQDMVFFPPCDTRMRFQLE